VEACLRSNFGRRYMAMLLGAFFFFLICSGLNPSPTFLTNLFLLGLLVRIISHFIQVFHRRRHSIAEPHSLSTGDSWNFWQRFVSTETTVKRYIEPGLCLVIGLFVSMLDPFLGFWLKASAVALFIKEQISRMKITHRIIEANDAKIAAQGLNIGLKQYQQGQSQGVQKSQRAHFPRNGQHP